MWNSLVTTHLCFFEIPGVNIICFYRYGAQEIFFLVILVAWYKVVSDKLTLEIVLFERR